MRTATRLAVILIATPLGFAAAQTMPQTAPGAAPGVAPGTTNRPVPAPASPSATPGSASRAEVVTAEQFMRMAAMSDRYEITASRIAEEKSRNTEVKRFAAMMTRDHEKTTKELQKLIQDMPGGGAGAGIAPPQGRETTGSAASGRMTSAQGGVQHEGLDPEHAALLQQLQAPSGVAFDRMYAAQQISAHQKAIDMFQAYARAGDNAALKAWAGQTLPALREHLQQAQKLQRQLQA